MAHVITCTVLKLLLFPLAFCLKNFRMSDNIYNPKHMEILKDILTLYFAIASNKSQAVWVFTNIPLGNV